MPLGRHTGSFPVEPIVHWRTPTQAQSIDFLKDGELLLQEQAAALHRNMIERHKNAQACASAEAELLKLYDEIKSYAIREYDDAAAVERLEHEVGRATHQLQVRDTPEPMPRPFCSYLHPCPRCGCQ